MRTTKKLACVLIFAHIICIMWACIVGKMEFVYTQFFHYIPLLSFSLGCAHCGVRSRVCMCVRA